MKNTPTFIIVPLLCWGIAEALYGCIQLYGLTASNHTLYRLTGSFQNPGPFAGFLATLLPISLWNVVQHKTTSCLTQRISIWLSGICLFLCVSLLPASMSRASWLAAGTGTAVVLASRYRLTSRIGRLFRTHRKQYIACLAAAFLLLALAGGGIYHLKKDSADGRLLMWKITLRIIAAHPLSGVGNGHFAGAYGEAQAAYFASGNASPQEEHVAGSPEYAFNEFLQIGAEHGLPGLALFLSLIAFTLRPSFRKRQPGIAASVVAFLVFSCFSYPFSVWQLQVLFAILTIDSAAASGNKYITTASLLLFAVPGILSLRQWHAQQPAVRTWHEEQTYYFMDIYEGTTENYSRLYGQLKNNPRFLFEYGQCLSKTGKYRESNRILHEGATLSSDPMFWNIIGKNHRRMKQYPQAEACFRHALNMVPNRLYPLYLLTDLYLEWGQPKKAMATARTLIDKQPKIMSPAVGEMKNEIKEKIKFITN